MNSQTKQRRPTHRILSQLEDFQAVSPRLTNKGGKKQKKILFINLALIAEK